MRLRASIACLLAFCASAAQATNYFSWGAENMVPQWGANGAATGTASLRSLTAIDCAVAHSGSCSMRVQPTGSGTNESTGIDLNGVPPNYPFNYLGSQLYYRWWMKIQPGFSWGDTYRKSKAGRPIRTSDFLQYYTGYIGGDSFVISECVASGHAGDCWALDGTSEDGSKINIPYNLDAKADGQWHEYIARVKVNTIGSCTPLVNCDADWQMYVDGVSVGRYQNFKLTSSGSTFLEWWGSWMTNPYFQMGSTVPAGGTIYLDDFSTDDVWNSTFAAGSAPVVQSVSCSTGIQAPGSSSCTAVATNSPTSYAWSGEGTNCSFSGSTASVNLTCSYGGPRTPCVTATNGSGTSEQMCVSSPIAFRYVKPTGFSASGEVVATTLNCTDWRTAHPEWLWCDDFETDTSASWVDRNNPSTFLRSAGNGYNGTYSMRATYPATSGIANAGDLMIAFGASPVTPKVTLADTTLYREIYWRAQIKTSANWLPGTGAKMTRATSFVDATWSQAMIAHFWDSSTPGILAVDPASGVCRGSLKPDGVTPCVNNTVITSGWNDFPNLYWLGIDNGTVPILQNSQANQWRCVEGHVLLNTIGSSNGVQELWIDGILDAQATGLNFVGTYATYGINIFRLENYMNAGTGQSQYRDWDNFVVSTQRVGCN